MRGQVLEKICVPIGVIQNNILDNSEREKKLLEYLEKSIEENEKKERSRHAHILLDIEEVKSVINELKKNPLKH